MDMPRRSRPLIGRNTAASRRYRNARAIETPLQSETRLALRRLRYSEARVAATQTLQVPVQRIQLWTHKPFSVDQLKNGASGSSLARKYGVGNATIADIKKNSDAITNYISALDNEDGRAGDGWPGDHRQVKPGEPGCREGSVGQGGDQRKSGGGRDGSNSVEPRGDRGEQTDRNALLQPERTKPEVQTVLTRFFKGVAEVSILNLTNEETNKKCVEFFTDAQFHKFISSEYLNENAADLLPEDKLTLYFKISLYEMVTSTIPLDPIKVTECRISNDFLFLLESKELSDVVLKADNNQEIHAHKAILSARSSVFAAMFRNDMKENKENTVDLSHIKYEVLVEVVKYIYTGTSTNLPQMAEQILPLAAMYELERLKHLCEKELSARVTIDTATKLLILADNHSAQQLKEYIINYIKAETAEILNSNDWNMMLSHPIQQQQKALLRHFSLIRILQARKCVLDRLRFLPIKKMDQRTCIKFCVKNEIKCADAFRMLTLAYGEATLDRSNVYRWYKMFSEGREDVKDEERARRPSTSTTDKKLMKWRKLYWPIVESPLEKLLRT
ncbi:SPOPL [Cordylochernes scorpioides]|uniref:SPOPL n=1 Tax=Cordylochernes scorpioides TaxID=51811 RepID=A0ABY6KYW3_9ARAC|nr:SPOPL [Cordylochernes scorpioides]